MPLLFSTLLGFFSSAGPFASFLVWIGKKITIKALVLPIQFAVMGSLVVAKVAFVTSILALILWVYNTLHSVLDNLSSVFSGSVILELTYKVFESIGLVSAFYNAFASFNMVWMSLLALLIVKIALHSLKEASDEFFKIGILLGI